MFALSTEGSRLLFAVPYVGRRRCKPIRLPEGMIVESADLGKFPDLPRKYPTFFEVDSQGRPCNPNGHFTENTLFIRYLGAFHLPSGQVALVYGGKAEPIG